MPLSVAPFVCYAPGTAGSRHLCPRSRRSDQTNRHERAHNQARREESMRISDIWTRARGCLQLLAVVALILPGAARAADPIRVGMSMALTGGVAPIGKQVLTALQIWRDDVNAKGGLLGRPVELVFYDDQSNPTTIPQLY